MALWTRLIALWSLLLLGTFANTSLHKRATQVKLVDYNYQDSTLSGSISASQGSRAYTVSSLLTAASGSKHCLRKGCWRVLGRWYWLEKHTHPCPIRQRSRWKWIRNLDLFRLRSVCFAVLHFLQSTRSNVSQRAKFTFAKTCWRF